MKDLFEKISKRGWLITGGTVSRATLIYDNAKKNGGLLTRFDYVGFDEVQSITFEQPGQIQQALKHYMELMPTESTHHFHTLAETLSKWFEPIIRMWRFSKNNGIKCFCG